MVRVCRWARIQNYYARRKARSRREVDVALLVELVHWQQREQPRLGGRKLYPCERDWMDQPWQQVREGLEVKLPPKSPELYLPAQSWDQVSKERAMRRRQLKGLWKRLKELHGQEIRRDDLLIK